MPKANQKTAEPVMKNWEDLSLAERISDILNDPKMPEFMLDQFMEALTTTFNHRSFNQDEIMAGERSPQYINCLLNGIGKRRGNQDA